MRRNLIIMLLSKGDKEMMAKLWVTEILSKDTIEEAKEEYNRVPRLLKEKVKNSLLMQAWRKLLSNREA